jgi:hypothetical protein
MIRRDHKDHHLQPAAGAAASAAMSFMRLLERNVREVTLQDAIKIYRSAY